MCEIKSDKRQIAGAIIALADGTCWGFSSYCGQYLFGQKRIKAPWLMTTRLFSASIILVLAGFKLRGGNNLKVFRRKRGTIHLLALAIFGITFCQFTYFTAIQASNARTATVLQYLSPILVLAVVCMRELRLPKGLELAAIGPSLFGTFVVGTHGDIHSFHITGEALFWDLLTTVSSTIYTIIPGGLVPKHDIHQVLRFGMFFDGITMGAVIRPWNYGVAWDASIVETLTDVVMVSTAIAFGLCLQGVSMIGPLEGNTMGSMEPVSAVVISVFWLGTRLILPDSLGFALVLGAIFVLTFAHYPGGEAAKGADFFTDS